MKLSSEQCELQDVVRRFFSQHSTSDYLRQRLANRQRSDENLWEALKALGLDEGFSGDQPVFGIEELSLMAEECGRALFPEPLVERILVTHIAAQLMTQEERAVYEQKRGSMTTAIAPNICCLLQVDPSSGTMSGEIIWAFGCDNARRVLAFADTAHGRRVVLASVEVGEVSVTPTESLDLTVGLSRMQMKDASVVVLSDAASVAIEDVFELLKASEMAGISRRVIEMTCDYVKTREQFGVPIGSFQAVQHSLANMYAASESLASLSRFAAWSAVHSREQRRLTSRAAILRAVDVVPRVCERALQCHGGIGFTWEYDLHLFLRRARALQSAFSITERRAEELLSAVS